ncbi:MAG: hypothetical protein ACOZQL_12795 [Myxococcota bacterium]
MLGPIPGVSVVVTAGVSAPAFIQASGFATVQNQTSFTGNAQQCVFGIAVDGVLLEHVRTAPAFSSANATVNPGIAVPFTIQRLTALTPGMHTITATFAVGAGTALGSCGANNVNLLVSLRE